MSRTVHSIELLVDFLSGAAHENDLPVTAASSSVESATVANIKSSAVAEQQQAAAAAAAAQQQQQPQQNSGGNAAAVNTPAGDGISSSTTTGDDGGEHKRKKEGAGDDDDPVAAASQQKKNNNKIAPNKRGGGGGSSHADDDDDEDDENEHFAAAEMMGGINNPTAAQREKQQKLKQQQQQQQQQHHRHDGGEDAGASLLSSAPRETAQARSFRPDLTSSPLDRGSPPLGGKQLEREQTEAQRRYLEAQERALGHLRKVEMVIVRLSPAWAAGVSGFWMDRWQEKTLQLLQNEFGVEAVEKMKKEQQQQLEQQQQMDQHQRVTENNNNNNNSSSAAESPTSSTLPPLFQQQQQQMIMFQQATQDHSLHVSIEICTCDAKTLLDDVLSMLQLHEKRAEALAAREAAMREALQEAERERKEKDAANAAKEERRRQRRNKKKGGGGGADMDIAASASTAAFDFLDETTMTGNTSNNNNNNNNADTMDALSTGSAAAVAGNASALFLLGAASAGIKVPPAPPVSRAVLLRLLLLLRPWTDAAQPTYLIFRRKILKQNPPPSSSSSKPPPAAAASARSSARFEDQEELEKHKASNAAAVLEELVRRDEAEIAEEGARNNNNNNNDGSATATTKQSSSSSSSSPLLFEFVEGVEGVDVPVIEDALTRICNVSKMNLAAALARRNAAVSPARMFLQHSANPAGSCKSLVELATFASAFNNSSGGLSSSDELPTVSMSSTTPRCNANNTVTLTAAASTNNNNHASVRSGVGGGRKMTMAPVIKSSASVADASFSTGTALFENSYSQGQRDQEQIAAVAASFISGGVDLDGKDVSGAGNNNNNSNNGGAAQATGDTIFSTPGEKSDKVRGGGGDDDDFYSDTDSSAFDLDDMEADETQRALQSAIEVLEIAQRAQKRDTISGNSNTLASGSLESSFGGHHHGHPNHHGYPNHHGQSIQTPSAFRGTSFRYPGGPSAAAGSDATPRKSIALLRPRPPTSSAAAGSAGMFSGGGGPLSPSKRGLNIQHQPSQQPFFSSASKDDILRSELKMSRRAQQQSIAALSQETLQRKQRSMSLGEYMISVRTGMFDLAAKKKLSRVSADRHQQHRQYHASDDDDDDEDGDGDDEFFASDLALKNAAEKSSSSKSKSSAHDDGAVGVGGVGGRSIKELTRTLFSSDVPSGTTVSLEGLPLEIMSKEERALVCAQAASNVLGADAIRRRQEQQKIESKNLFRLFPRTHRARAVAAFVVQTAWRRMCQWRRIGVMIDGKFYTHAEAHQMRKMQRLAKLESRRDALMQEKISEVIQRIWRGTKAKLVLIKLQRQATMSLKVANEYAKRRAKRTGVYCASPAAFGTLGIPLAPPFDKKAFLLAQLEGLRTQWISVCKLRERELLEESFMLPSSPLRILRTQLNNVRSSGGILGGNNNSSGGISGADASVNSGAMPSIAQLIGEQGVSAGEAATLMLFQAVEKPQAMLPQALVAGLITCSLPSALAAPAAAPVSSTSAAAAAAAAGKGSNKQQPAAKSPASSPATTALQVSPARVAPTSALRVLPQYAGNKVSPFGVVGAALMATVQQQRAAAVASAAAAAASSGAKRSLSSTPRQQHSSVKAQPAIGAKTQQIISAVEMLATIELLLPRQLFAPEATWIEARLVLLSKMNEEEFRIITTKCLNPK